MDGTGVAGGRGSAGSERVTIEPGFKVSRLQGFKETKRAVIRTATNPDESLKP
jgi:hypothetical protein